MPYTRYRPFPTAPSDAEWAVLEPLLPAPSPIIGRPLKWPRRLMAEAIFCLVRSGCAWRFLPHCFPPWPTVCSQFRRWRRGLEERPEGFQVIPRRWVVERTLLPSPG